MNESSLISVLGAFCFLQGEKIEVLLEEFNQLALTAGYSIRSIVTQTRRAPDPRFFFGKGKSTEITAKLKELSDSGDVNGEIVLVGNILTPRQLFHLERSWDTKVVDKKRLILEIFEGRPNTQATQLQIAEMRILDELPIRKHRLRKQLFRQRKGRVGGRGSGESPLSSFLAGVKSSAKSSKKKGLKDIERVQKQLLKRHQQNLRHLSLVGYTGAGKTSLLNTLTSADKEIGKGGLFTTLETVTRRISDQVDKDLARVFLISDTVGFMEGLGSDFVQAFQTSLEHTRFAHLVLIVLDGSESRSQIERKLQTTLSTLIEIDNPDILSKIVLCLNKCDLITSIRRARIDNYLQELHSQFPCVWISAKAGIQGCENLLELLKQTLHHVLLRLTITKSASSNLEDFIEEMYNQEQYFQINHITGTVLDLNVAEGVVDETIQWLENMATKNGVEITTRIINQDVG